jgi:hypothetical protein
MLLTSFEPRSEKERKRKGWDPDIPLRGTSLNPIS